MAVKVFNREGLRRDFNLSDLTAPETALNNILATPTMLGNNDSFTIADLLPITQIYVTNITSSTFASLDGVTVTFTVVDENGVIDNATNPKVYRPLIKVKNRLDTAYFSTGEPFFFGGDGPNATYYDSDKIVRNPESLILGKIYEDNIIVLSSNKLYRSSLEATTASVLTHTSGVVAGFEYVADYDPETIFLNEEFDAITGEKTTITDNFWEKGQFIYGNKVQNAFISLFGGVGWQGFFKPVVSGISRFYLRTTGSSVFKFQDPSSQSFQSLKYGKVDMGDFATDGTQYSSTPGWQRINNALQDPTRQIVEVRLDEAALIQNDDKLYIEVQEGPLVPKQYSIFTYFDTPTSITKFFVEVTVDFNRKNINVNDLDAPGTDTGYRGVARYLPYERRQLKTYLNSIYHRLTFTNGTYTPTSATTFTADDFEYYHVMENDYIYDYRKRTSDLVQGVRRWIVTNVSDSSNTVTVELDTTYSIDEGDYNDQQAYSGLDNSVIFTDNGNDITTVYTTGSFNDTLDLNSTTEVLFVGRYGETTPRTKYITITQFLENYVDYAFDWLYYTKDEDIDPATQNKAWILWYKAETAGAFSPLNYKYLYDKEYEFYQIGDFKIFLDNSVTAGGTSRDQGIDQRAFGKEQLDNKGDQYNTLFSLLPVKSEYNPPVKWNDVALSRTLTLRANSRLVSFNNSTDIEPGNYLFQDNDASFTTGDNLPFRTRVNELLNASNSIISSRNATTGASVAGFVFDHRGFVTSGTLTFDGVNDYLIFEGEGSELQLGMCMVIKGRATQSTYVRISRIDYDEVNDNYQLRLNVPHETLFDNVGVFYASTEQETAVNGSIPASGDPYWIDISPADADLNYNTVAPNRFPVHDGSNSTYVYWVGPTEYNTGNVEMATFDLRDFAAAAAGGTGTGITDVRVRGYQPFSGGGYNYVHYNAVLLDKDKNPINNTILAISNTSVQLRQLPNSNNSNARYLKFYTSANYPSAYPRLNLYRIQVNGQFVDNNAVNTVTDRVAFYYDRGVDITKPLQSFCNGTACAQNKYEGEDAITEHIGLFIGKGVINGNDQRFTNPQNGFQVQIQNSAAKVSYWRDFEPNVMDETVITNKTYRSNAVYAKLDGTALGAELSGLGHPNFPLTDYVPVGYIEGMIRITGEIWDGENSNIKTATTGFTGSVADNATFQVTLDNTDNIEGGSYVYVNGRYCEATVVNTNTGVTTIRNRSGATRNFSIPDNSTLDFANQIYYFIVRIADRWQSLTDFDTTADGIQVGKVLDFTKFPSSAFDLQYLAFPTVQDQYYTNGGNIGSLSTLTSYYNSFNSYADRFFEVTSTIVLTATELAYFFNPTSFAPQSGTTYVLEVGTYLHFSTRAGNMIVWFESFEDFQGDYSAYSLHPTTAHKGNTTGSLNNLGSLKNQNLISMHPSVSKAGEVLPQGSTDPLDMPFQFLHYRRKQYELLPLHYSFNETFPFLRLINPLTKTQETINGELVEVERTLQNSVNKLSVYTFANDLDNKELCCPPLDTSPPFDSSAIGLSTTLNEPDMSIGGLVNVRSLSGNHPENKIHNIPSGQSNTSLPVDKKLEIVFGGATYDLLIGDTKPF